MALFGGEQRAASSGATSCGCASEAGSSPGNAFDRILVATGPGSNRLTRSRVVRDLLRPGQHQVFHPRLRRPHRPPIRLGCPRSAFGHKHRATRRRQAQQWIASADQPPRRRQVHREHRSSRLAGYGTPGSTAQRAGVVDQHVQPAEALEQASGRWHRSVRLQAGPAAAASPRRPGADRVVGLLQAALGACGDHHTRAQPASSTATAAPMPRLAPVTSATAPSSAPAIQSFAVSRLSCRSELSVLVGQGNRIIAGEAGIAVVRRAGIAARLAQCAIQPVDRNERQAVGADQIGHLLDVVRAASNLPRSGVSMP